MDKVSLEGERHHGYPDPPPPRDIIYNMSKTDFKIKYRSLAPTNSQKRENYCKGFEVKDKTIFCKKLRQFVPIFLLFSCMFGMTGFNV